MNHFFVVVCLVRILESRMFGEAAWDRHASMASYGKPGVVVKLSPIVMKVRKPPEALHAFGSGYGSRVA